MFAICCLHSIIYIRNEMRVCVIVKVWICNLFPMSDIRVLCWIVYTQLYTSSLKSESLTMIQPSYRTTFTQHTLYSMMSKRGSCNWSFRLFGTRLWLVNEGTPIRRNTMVLVDGSILPRYKVGSDWVAETDRYVTLPGFSWMALCNNDTKELLVC